MNFRIIFFEPSNSSSSETSTFRSSIVVMAFLKEPLILKNGISLMLKSSGVRLWDFRTSCSISPNLPWENLVL